jgi:purine-binding chemotaxis protein CheW
MAKLGETSDEKYLTFRLAGADYGIGILKIREIVGMTTITDIPQTPEWVKGVINLRGKIIPVIDLRLRFSLKATEYTERTCLIIVTIVSIKEKPIIGIVVDSVSEVLNIKHNDIEETPSFGARLNTDYILGMAKIGGGIKTLLDIDQVLCSDEVAMLSQVA